MSKYKEIPGRPNAEYAFCTPVGIAEFKSLKDIESSKHRCFDVGCWSEVLARSYRYSAATPEPISVLVHTLALYEFLTYKFPKLSACQKLAILLHDAPEFLVGDMTRAIKKHVDPQTLERLKDLEESIIQAIVKYNGLNLDKSNFIMGLDFEAYDSDISLVEMNYLGYQGLPIPKRMTPFEFNKCSEILSQLMNNFNMLELTYLFQTKFKDLVREIQNETNQTKRLSEGRSQSIDQWWGWIFSSRTNRSR